MPFSLDGSRYCLLRVLRAYCEINFLHALLRAHYMKGSWWLCVWNVAYEMPDSMNLCESPDNRRPDLRAKKGGKPKKYIWIPDEFSNFPCVYINVTASRPKHVHKQKARLQSVPGEEWMKRRTYWVNNLEVFHALSKVFSSSCEILS